MLQSRGPKIHSPVPLRALGSLSRGFFSVGQVASKYNFSQHSVVILIINVMPTVKLINKRQQT